MLIEMKAKAEVSLNLIYLQLNTYKKIMNIILRQNNSCEVY